MHMAPATDAAPSALLALPNELLIEILKELLTPTHDEPIRSLNLRSDIYNTNVMRLEPNPQLHGLHPNVLRTCQNMYQIGVEILYQYRGFDVRRYASRVCELWTRTIGPINLSFIKSMTIPLRFGFNRNGKRWLPSQSQQDTCRTLSMSATNLQDLTVIVQEFSRTDDINMIDRIVTYMTLATITSLHKLDFVVSDGHLAGLWIWYLQEKLKVPIGYQAPKYRSQSLYSSGLRGVIGRAAKEMQESSGIISQLEDQVLATYTTNPNMAFLHDLNVIGERSDTHLVFGSAVGGTWCKSDPIAIAARRTQALDAAEKAHSLLSKLWSRETELYSGKFWPPINFHREQLQIETEKFNFLRNYWMELKDLGLIVPYRQRTTNWDKTSSRLPCFIA
jgi:hypothetical protein